MTATSTLPDRVFSFGVDFLNELEACFQAGYDAEKFGVTPANCDISLFSTPEKLEKWEAGRALALKIKALGLP